MNLQTKPQGQKNLLKNQLPTNPSKEICHQHEVCLYQIDIFLPIIKIKIKEIILEGIQQDPNFSLNYASKSNFSPGVEISKEEQKMQIVDWTI